MIIHLFSNVLGLWKPLDGVSRFPNSFFSPSYLTLNLLHIPQVVLLLVLIFLWKLVDNRRKKTSSTTTAKSNSNSKEDHHPQLPLPYPQPPSDAYEDIVSTKELGPDSCKCGSNIPKCSFFFFFSFFFFLKSYFHSNLHPSRPISHHKRLQQLSHLSRRLIQANGNPRTSLEVEGIRSKKSFGVRPS